MLTRAASALMIPTVWKENLLNVFSPQSPNIVYGHTGIFPCTLGSCRVWLTLLSGSPRWVVDHGNVANVYSPHTHPSPVQWHKYTQMDSVLINRHAREANVLIFQRICQIPGELVSFECEHKHLLQFSQNGSFLWDMCSIQCRYHDVGTWLEFLSILGTTNFKLTKPWM